MRRAGVVVSILVTCATLASAHPALAASTRMLTSPTANSWPNRITLGPDGNLWFGEYTAAKVARITPDGRITEFAGVGDPWGIVSGPDGNLWFTTYPLDFGAPGHIGRVTPSGDLQELELPDFQIAQGITAGPDGNVWFTALGAIGYVTPSFDFRFFDIPGPNFPSAGITQARDGNLWFTESHGIGRITPSGVVSDHPVASSSWLSRIVAGPGDRLWFTDPDDGLVGRITLDGDVRLSNTLSFHPGDLFGRTGPGAAVLWLTAGQENAVVRMRLR